MNDIWSSLNLNYSFNEFRAFYYYKNRGCRPIRGDMYSKLNVDMDVDPSKIQYRHTFNHNIFSLYLVHVQQQQKKQPIVGMNLIKFVF